MPVGLWIKLKLHKVRFLSNWIQPLQPLTITHIKSPTADSNRCLVAASWGKLHDNHVYDHSRKSWTGLIIIELVIVLYWVEWNSKTALPLPRKWTMRPEIWKQSVYFSSGPLIFCHHYMLGNGETTKRPNTSLHSEMEQFHNIIYTRSIDRFTTQEPCPFNEIPWPMYHLVSPEYVLSITWVSPSRITWISHVVACEYHMRYHVHRYRSQSGHGKLRAEQA
jgi:hypothetical protein